MREKKFPEFKGQIAPLSDPDRVVQGLRTVGKQLPHLLRRLQVELVRREPHTLPVFQRFAGLNAEKHLMGLCVLAINVMTIIGGDQRDGKLPAQCEEPAVDLLLIGKAVFHDLQKEMIVPENFTVFHGGISSRLHVLLHQ